jgi:hypothetical protein
MSKHPEGTRSIDSAVGGASDQAATGSRWEFKHFICVLGLMIAATLIASAMPPLGTGLAYYVGMYIGQHFYD